MNNRRTSIDDTLGRAQFDFGSSAVNKVCELPTETHSCSTIDEKRMKRQWSSRVAVN